MILVDVMMPGMDGFEFCERAVALNPEKHTPIMVMTALNDYDSVKLAYEKGASDFITNPSQIPSFF